MNITRDTKLKDLLTQYPWLKNEISKRFEEAHGLPFTLLSDTELSTITAYDVLRPGKDGKPTKSLIRSTYLIDEDGIIIKAFGGVKPKDNAVQMLEEL